MLPALSRALRFSATVSILLFTAQTALAENYVGHAVSKGEPPAYGPDFNHFDYVNPDAPKGGTVKLGAVGGFDSLNPFIIKGQAAGISSLLDTGFVYMALTERGEDEVFAQYGGLARTIEYPEDYSWVAFELRPEAVWHDGEPITAEDVVWTFNTLREVGHPIYASYYADVDTVTAESERRVKFQFKRAGNGELPLIMGQLPILPKHYWTAEDRNLGDTTLEPPLGSGPYRVATVDSPRSVTLERVEDWWAADLPVFKGQYNFDRIDIDYYRDANVQLEAFKGGALDFRVENTARNWATAYDIPAIKRGDMLKEQIEHDLPQGMQAFSFNLRRQIFQDIRVRQALIELFDFEWMNKTIFYDSYTRTDSYFENSDLASSGLPSGRELEILETFRDQLNPAVFTETYTPPTTGDGTSMRDNLRTAMQLLQQAGYSVRDGKMVHAETGKPLAFEVLLFQKSFERVVLPFRQNLERLGIDVSVRLVDSNQYVQRVRDFDFDMITQVLPQSDSPGNEQREYWHSSNVDVSGSRNYMGVSDPVVDRLVEMVIQAPDRDELVYRVRALDRVLLHGHYVIPHWHLTRDRVAYWNKLQRPEVTPKNGIDLNNWWVKP
ncbi:MAG TPA: hypothetical protein DFI00_08990 [Rhodospirillaceae bacterium]|nr:hypothetical protein [Rhodospirillaceae bacterium]